MANEKRWFEHKKYQNGKIFKNYEKKKKFNAEFRNFTEKMEESKTFWAIPAKTQEFSYKKLELSERDFLKCVNKEKRADTSNRKKNERKKHKIPSEKISFKFF